jgi:rhodanese-related sulfurtransferase
MSSRTRRAVLVCGALLGAAVLAVPFARGPLLGGFSRLLVLGLRDVTWIASDDLARSLAQPAPTPLLLDTRSEAEFGVSRLPGARRLDPGRPDIHSLASLPKDTPLVVYCAVGYRSAQIARRLREAGFSRVANLEGGVFRWAREGRPLVDHAGPATRIHPYDPVSGWLFVEPEHRGPAE